MKTAFLAIVLATASVLGAAQTSPGTDTGLTGKFDNLPPLSWEPAPTYASVQEKITAGGEYVWKFTDPNNQFRCFLTAEAMGSRYNVQSFIVACVIPVEPVQDVPKAKE